MIDMISHVLYNYKTDIILSVFPGGRVVGKSINQLNKLVKIGKVPKGIHRFDKGRGTKNLPFDEVHFKDGSSLYKKGTWRHNNGYQITNKQATFLQENGWIIP